jgi:hypothetical protein
MARDRVTLLAALLAPFTMCVVLVPFRAGFANTNSALLLVLVVVAVAANGNRIAGVLAALSAGVWFDFFLTQPYEHFTISNRSDIETAVLLLLVGVGVTELAAWGRRQHLLASRQAGYLAGIQAAAQVVAGGGALNPLVEQVAGQLTRILGLTGCRFEYGTALDHPRLGRDGRVTWRGKIWDVDRLGMPRERDTELIVETGTGFWGRFLLTAGPDTRPSLTQRQVAAALADQVGAGMSDYALSHPAEPGRG